MLIPYLGEKSKFSNFIIPHIPRDISTYVEPFGGMFGIFFSLDHTKFNNIKFIYNDINYLNYNLFNQIKNNNDFLDLINLIDVDYNVYKQSLLNININIEPITLAIDWLIVLSCSNPQGIGKDSYISNKKFETFKIKFNYYKFYFDKITTLHNDDYTNIITLYDSKDSFFYIDPPYNGKEDYYINHNFNKDSHKELATILNNIQGKFMLSYYNFDGLKELYTSCRFESKKTIMGTELLIMNY